MNAIQILKNKINRWNNRYYNEHTSEVSDQEFDFAVKELEQMEAESGTSALDSPTRLPGSDHSAGFQKAAHPCPMLSLKNAYEVSELSQLLRESPEVVIEPKYDGCSLELIYESGRLVQAITRGDGITGDDVTLQALRIGGIPHQLPTPVSITVRGEVLMSFAAFNALNENRNALGLDRMANPRNAASGSLKLQDPNETAERGLEFRAWSLFWLNSSDDLFVQSSDLNRLGFETETFTAYGASEISEVLANIEARRDEYPWPIDGAVIKLRHRSDRERLGEGSKYPNWAMAYKFAAEIATTSLTGVRFQVGRTGKITPVAEFNPVWLAGTSVSNATLHNCSALEGLDLHIGCRLHVEKGGEIIPKITRSVRTQSGAAAILAPEVCPVCGERLSASDSDLICTNPACSAQLSRSLEYFARVMGMKGFGPTVIDMLIEEGFVLRQEGFFQLAPDTLRYAPGMGKGSAAKLYEAAMGAKSAPAARVIEALGIRYIGASAARLLAERFGTVIAMADGIRAEGIAAIMDIDGIGVAAATSLAQFVGSHSGYNLIRGLGNLGVSSVYQLPEQAAPRSYGVSEISQLPLSGKTVVITGFGSAEKERIAEMIRTAGGKTSGSVSGKTAILVSGPTSGPSKLAAAESLGISILSADQLAEMIG